MTVYLFRHGQTVSNAAGRYVGSTNEPLCDLGIEPARAAGCDPRVEEVVVSPLIRTQMTAEILFPKARQRIVTGLREMTFGRFEGRSAREMAQDGDYRYWVEQTQCMGPCPHGDATLVFQHRVCAAFASCPSCTGWPGLRPPIIAGCCKTVRATAARRRRRRRGCGSSAWSALRR